MLRMKRSRARQQRQKPKAKLRLSAELDTLPSMRRPTPSSAHQQAETMKAKHGGRRRSPHRRAPLIHDELTFSMHEGRAPHLSTMSSPSPSSGQGPSLAPRRYQAEGRAPFLDDELIFIVSMYHRRAQASSWTQGKTDLKPCMVSEDELRLCRTPSLYQAWQQQMCMRRKTIPNSENTDEPSSREPSSPSLCKQIAEHEGGQTGRAWGASHGGRAQGIWPISRSALS
ncbi:hypothetical protein Dimus_003502 [Dionaea muscipula]